MKKIVSLALAVLSVALVFCGCSGKRQLFNVNLEKYLTLGDYKNIVVDTSSDEYNEYRDYVFESYVYNASAYDQVTEGTVSDGDTVNIDYTGKKDGVAFDGGTAQGQLLTIGSDSFIDGFEDGLIGVAAGSTVDLNLKFPENYGNDELNGQEVVFTVTVNYIQKLPEINDTLAVKLGFSTSDELVAELDLNAKNYIIAQAIINGTSINKYSPDDKEIFDKVYTDYISQMETYANSYNVSLDDFLTYYVGTTKAAVQSNITAQMEGSMAIYAVADKEGIKVTDKLIDDYVTKLAQSNGTSSAQIRENYEDWELENYALQEKVLTHIADNYATVK